MCAYSPHEKNLVNYPNSRTKYLERKSQEILPVIILVRKQSEMTHSQKYYFIKQCSELEQNTKEERKGLPVLWDKSQISQKNLQSNETE